jgi:predicted regulator of Ras-like GTPase activity (Roadblock/LC7/MglB family)
VIDFIETLSRSPGVEYVLLISHDGVLIAHASGTSESARDEGLAALTAAWLNDLTHAIAPLGWHAPDRICLRAARGTVVLRRTESASLVVWLGRAASPEDVRLSMDGTLARIERARTGRPVELPGSFASHDSASHDSVQHDPAQHDPAGSDHPPQAPIPYRQDGSPVEEGVPPASQPGQVPGD